MAASDLVVTDESAARMEQPGVIRVVSYPDDQRNPYFTLFYRALEAYGVTVSYSGAISDRMIIDPEHPFPAVE
jgi:hypothetical protein